MEKVEFSLWATPMVQVPKADGTTWSCGDYAITVNPQFKIPQYPISLPMSLSSCKGQMIQQAWFNESSPKTPIGTWQSTVCNHQYTLWSVLVQKATLWYCIILGKFSADHGHHSSRSWACCSHSTWHSDHGTGWWTAHSESELCFPLPKQFWLATSAQQERVYAAVSNLYWLCHICWRNLPNRGKHLKTSRKHHSLKTSANLEPSSEWSTSTIWAQFSSHSTSSFRKIKSSCGLQIVNRPLTRQRNTPLSNMSWCITITT